MLQVLNYWINPYVLVIAKMINPSGNFPSMLTNCLMKWQDHSLLILSWLINCELVQYFSPLRVSVSNIFTISLYGLQVIDAISGVCFTLLHIHHLADWVLLVLLFWVFCNRTKKQQCKRRRYSVVFYVGIQQLKIIIRKRW